MTQLAVRDQSFTNDQIDLIRRTVAKDASDEELALFLYTANSRGLDPLLRQIHAVSRYDKQAGRKVMSIQVGIDGYRLLAERTGAYAGNDDPEFEYADDALPVSATVTVYKIVQGMRCPFTAKARWSEYFPGDQQGFMWKRMPHTMLGKCAESLALRKAFPAEMSGLFVHEEMQQAGSSQVDVIDASPAPVAPVTRQTRDDLVGKYTRLVERAHELDIDLDPQEWGISVDTPVAEIKRLGESLSELIRNQKAEQAKKREARLEEVGAF